MTETTKTVFEQYQIRKSGKQKAAFRKYVKSVSENLGYSFNEEKGSLGATNIIVGDPEKAKVVYTAHYDTCAVLPFPNFITPKNIGLYLLYNAAIVLGFFALFGLLGFVCAIGTALASLLFEIPIATASLASLGIYESLNTVLLIALIALMLFGPANKHTANDNTSGVTTLLDLMAAMPEEQREKAAFIFFDLEELGLFGSMGYASKHKEVRNGKLIINFDCVSDGENFIFTIPKKAKDFAPAIEEAYKSDKYSVEVLTKGYFYPSDQASFKLGVGVASLKKTKGGILYMNRIHTKKDIIYQEENIEYLVNASVKLTEGL